MVPRLWISQLNRLINYIPQLKILSVARTWTSWLVLLKAYAEEVAQVLLDSEAEGGGVQVRGLAHPGHWKGPLGPIFEAFGAVKASPMSAYKLLKEGEAVLLFPGGGREVCSPH